jgi:PAS domain-containing protein
MSKEKNLSDTQSLRIKAEEKLREKYDKEIISNTEHDAKKLLHELQVHQIELEMQNEELREANEVAEKALRKYTMLYDLAPMGYFTLEPDGTIVELNFTGAEMLRDRRFSLVGTNFKLFVSDESKAVFNEFIKHVFIENYKQTCKLKLGYDNNPLGYVYMEGVSIGEEKRCLLSVMEITDSSKAT